LSAPGPQWRATRRRHPARRCTFDELPARIMHGPFAVAALMRSGSASTSRDPMNRGHCAAVWLARTRCCRTAGSDLLPFVAGLRGELPAVQGQLPWPPAVRAGGPGFAYSPQVGLRRRLALQSEPGLCRGKLIFVARICRTCGFCRSVELDTLENNTRPDAYYLGTSPAATVLSIDARLLSRLHALM